MRLLIALALAMLIPLAAGAETTPPAAPEPGSVSLQDGLAAWSRIYEVTSHPRCANCHVGPSDRPMWSGPSYGKTRPHGMNIRADESRIGAETIPCRTCHATTRDKSTGAPHHAPQVTDAWMLAPVEAHWFGRSSDEICAQLRDTDLNGGRDFLEIAEHLGHDVILHWAWEPGGGREPAPYSLAEHTEDVLAWGAAGMPCPADQ